jgi:hypothetical protein
VAEAFLLYLAKRGQQGDGFASLRTLEAIEKGRTIRPEGLAPVHIVIRSAGAGKPYTALRVLGAAKKLDAFRPSTRILLEPWLVEAALDRLGPRRLSMAEQVRVWKATRSPRKVNWPDWWSYRPPVSDD